MGGFYSAKVDIFVWYKKDTEGVLVSGMLMQDEIRNLAQMISNESRYVRINIPARVTHARLRIVGFDFIPMTQFPTSIRIMS